MIESGLGVGVLPEGAARPFVGSLELRMLQLADPRAVRKMYVCVRDFNPNDRFRGHGPLLRNPRRGTLPSPVRA